MNRKEICADMAFQHTHDMQEFYRMHNVKKFPTGLDTPWPNIPGMGVRLFKKFLSVLVDTASKILDKTTNHTCPVDAQGSDGEKHTGNSEWQNAYGVCHGKETKRSHGPSFHESRTADIYSNKTRLAQ